MYFKSASKWKETDFPPPKLQQMTYPLSIYDQISSTLDREISQKSYSKLSSKEEWDVNQPFEFIKDNQLVNPPNANPSKQQQKKPKSSRQSHELTSRSEADSEKGRSKDEYSKKGGLTRSSLIASGMSAKNVRLEDDENDELAFAGILFRKIFFLENQKDDSLEVLEEHSLEEYSLLFEYLWFNKPFKDSNYQSEDFIEECKAFVVDARNKNFEDDSEKLIYNLESFIWIQKMYQTMKNEYDIQKNSRLEDTPHKFYQLSKNFLYSFKRYFAFLKNLCKIVKKKEEEMFEYPRAVIRRLKKNIQTFEKYQNKKGLMRKIQKDKDKKKKENKEKKGKRKIKKVEWKRIVNTNFTKAFKEINEYLNEISKMDNKRYKLIDIFADLNYDMSRENPQINKIFWNKVDNMRSFLKNEISKKINYSPNFNVEESAQIISKNVATANIKFNFKNDRYAILPLLDENFPVFAFSDLDNFTKLQVKIEQKSSLLKIVWKTTQYLSEIEEDRYELNHSEKAIFGFIYEKAEDLMNQLVTKMTDEDIPHDFIDFFSIEIQIFSFRDSCIFCESFLSCKNSILFQELMKHYLNIFDRKNAESINKFIEKKQRVTKNISFALKIQSSEKKNEMIDKNRKESKNLKKDKNEKDFFSKEFLMRFLTRKEFLTNKRTFFVSTPKEKNHFEIYKNSYLDKEKNTAQIINGLVGSSNKFFLLNYHFF